MVPPNTKIAGYAQNGHRGKAPKLFQQMKLATVKFSAQKFVSVFLACAFLAALGQGGEFHAEVVRGGFQYNVFVGCAVMDMYANVKYRDCPPYVRQNASTRFGVMDSDDRRICHEWLWQRGH